MATRWDDLDEMTRHVDDLEARVLAVELRARCVEEIGRRSRVMAESSRTFWRRPVPPGEVREEAPTDELGP